MKVYLIECGAYSDYHIYAVVSTEEKAIQFVANRSTHTDIGYTEFEVDEIPIMPERSIQVVMDREGDVVRITRREDDVISDRIEWYYWNWKGKQDPLMAINVFTEDEQRAIKVANEKRAQLIATDGWNQN